MKKVLKIIGIVILVLVICLLALLKYLGNRPAAPADYQKTVQTGGDIESQYMSSGPYEVSTYEETALQGFSKYIICYPSKMTEDNHIYPVIILSNGTGVPMSKYLAVAEHFSSWGFIVIGTEEEYDWNGFAAEMCVRHLRLLNEEETINKNENIFYQKVDLDHVGVVGHSQGGVGTINAITAQQSKDFFKAAVSISPTNKEMAKALQWDYDATLVNIPIMLLSGAGGGDDWVVTVAQLENIYKDISSDKIMFCRKDTPHGEMLYSANGYVTAWFMYWLQGDEEAGKAFIGDSSEIMNNDLYQDQKINLIE